MCIHISLKEPPLKGCSTVQKIVIEIVIEICMEQTRFFQCNWFHSTDFYSTPQCAHCKRCTSYGNSVCLSVCLSVRPSATRRYCVKTTARSTVQFALLDSKMCLVL